MCVFVFVYVCWPAVRMSTCVCVCVRAWRHAYWKLLLMMFRSRNAQAAAKHRLEYVLAGRISVQIPIYIYYTLSIGRCWPDDADDSLHVLMKGNGNLAYNCQTTIPGYSDYSTRWSITYFNAQHIEISSNKLKQVNSLYHVLAGCQNTFSGSPLSECEIWQTMMHAVVITMMKVYYKAFNQKYNRNSLDACVCECAFACRQ